MSKTLIYIDVDLLTQAQEILGTNTKKSTVNGALREVARRECDGVFAEIAAHTGQDVLGTYTFSGVGTPEKV